METLNPIYDKIILL